MPHKRNWPLAWLGLADWVRDGKGFGHRVLPSSSGEGAGVGAIRERWA